MLEHENEMRRARMGALRESGTGEMSDGKDGEDGSASLVELSVGLAALDLSSPAVQRLEAALRRLEAGKYGICSDCGAPLSSARLRALPAADVCRDCQEQRDSPSVREHGRHEGAN
jgi:DnaK suppressor protein